MFRNLLTRVAMLPGHMTPNEQSLDLTLAYGSSAILKQPETILSKGCHQAFSEQVAPFNKS